MLAVILTKSFRCLCFILKCTYPYFSVYLNCVFGTACVCVRARVCVHVCVCLQTLCCQRGLSKGTKGDEETLVLCKWKYSSYSSLLCGFSRAVNNIPLMQAVFSVFGVHTSVSGCKRKGKMGNRSRKIVFSSLKKVPHNEMLRVPYCLCWDTRRCYCEWHFYCWLSVILQVKKMPSFHSLGIPLWS